MEQNIKIYKNDITSSCTKHFETVNILKKLYEDENIC